MIGLRIAEKHANARGFAHGGLLVTLADIALGYQTAFGQDPPAGLITANLTADFAGAAKIGDWVEAHVDVQKLGGRLAFANAFLVVDGERIVRASAVFTRAGPLTDHRSPNDAPSPARSAVRRADEPARHRAEAREAVSPAARPRRRRASSICCSICRPARSTAARGRSCATSCPDTVVTVAVTVDRHRPPPPNRPRAPYQIYASDETGDIILTYFNARRDYLEKLLPVGELRYVSGTTALYDGMLQMVHPDRVVDEADLAKLPLVEPVYPLTEGLSLELRCARRSTPRSAEVPELPEWQDAAWLRAASNCRPSREALAALHRPDEPARRRARNAGLVAARL